MCDICTPQVSFGKSGYVNVQMYWLLIKTEYIIVFVYFVIAIANNTVRITATKRVTHQKSKTWPVFRQPWPKGVVVDLVNSNHV
jgi:hypothetical protein